MSEKNSLRHFSQRRRLRRRERLFGRRARQRSSAHVPRVWLSARFSLLPATIARLAAAGDSFKMSRARLIGAVLEWFAIQPQLIQAAVVTHRQYQSRVDFSQMVLQRLLDG